VVESRTTLVEGGYFSHSTHWRTPYSGGSGVGDSREANPALWVAALEAADRGGCDRFDGQFLPAVVRAIAKEKAG